MSIIDNGGFVLNTNTPLSVFLMHNVYMSIRFSQMLMYEELIVLVALPIEHFYL